MPTRPRVAIVHDYLTQRGGAERVVLAMARAFPDATIYTSLYEPASTFEEFENHRVVTSVLNHVAALRARHRLGLPAYPIYFGNLTVDADVVVASSSAFAHEVRSTGKVLVYCHNPARFLYQGSDYHRDRGRLTQLLATAALWPMRSLVRRAARRADLVLCNARVVRERIAEHWGVDAELLPPPPAITAEGPVERVPGVAEGGALLVTRLMAHKRVDLALEGARRAGVPAVVVGSGPDEEQLRHAFPEATFLGAVRDEQLRWLYANADLHLTASHEDFGLTPLEAAAFGTPTVAPNEGGFLDTVVEGVTGTFFTPGDVGSLARALRDAQSTHFDATAITAHAQAFGEERFAARLAALVDELAR